MSLLNNAHERIRRNCTKVAGAVKSAIKSFTAFVGGVVGRAVMRVIVLVLSGAIIALLGGLDGLVNAVLVVINAF